MKFLIESLEQSIKDENWYSALFLLVTIPDICSKIDKPTVSTNKRYPNWINSYLHKLNKGYGNHICGDDFYALRCSLLHEGHSDIEGKTAQRRIHHFRFLAGESSHLISLINNNDGSKLDSKHIVVLSVKCLAEDMIIAYNLWYEDIKSNSNILKVLQDCISIDSSLIVGGIRMR